MLLTDVTSTRKTHYEVLSLREDASYHDIRMSYKAAILDTHPDKLQAKTSTSKAENELEDQFLNVQKAWEVLSNPKLRAEYDMELQAYRQELEVVANEIDLGDMMVETIGDRQEFFYQCRCGDYFSVTSLELQEMGISFDTDGKTMVHSSSNGRPVSVILPCISCSLKVRLTLTVDC